MQSSSRFISSLADRVEQIDVFVESDGAGVERAIREPILPVPGAVVEPAVHNMVCMPRSR